jgi:hypothetical protein
MKRSIKLIVAGKARPVVYGAMFRTTYGFAKENAHFVTVP